MSWLPRFVCFKSEKNKKYLRYKIDTTLTRSLAKFDGEDVMDPYAPFEVMDANIGGGLVHLKCRYTNLYLVRWSRSHFWFSASAYKPVEDQTTWNCTLFKPILVEDFGNTKTIRLLHVQLGAYLCLPKSVTSACYDSCLLADLHEPDYGHSFDLLTVVDCDSLYKLPKRVAFKGDNGLYLGPMLVDGRPALTFSYREARDLKVAHEIISFCDGTISIKSEYYKSFWRVLTEVHNFIVVDGDGPNDAKNGNTGTFRVIPIDINVFAFICMNPSKFVKRYDIPGIRWSESIAAIQDCLDEYGRIEVVSLDQFPPSPQQQPDLRTTDLPTN